MHAVFRTVLACMLLAGTALQGAHAAPPSPTRVGEDAMTRPATAASGSLTLAPSLPNTLAF